VKRVLLVVIVAALPASSHGGGLTVLDDHHDSFQSVRAAQMTPGVAAQMEALEGFLDGIVPRHLFEVEKVLGRPRCHWADSTYVMPLAQSRS